MIRLLWSRGLAALRRWLMAHPRLFHGLRRLLRGISPRLTRRLMQQADHATPWRAQAAKPNRSAPLPPTLISDVEHIHQRLDDLCTRAVTPLPASPRCGEEGRGQV